MIETIIRKLARTNKYQSLYARAKELHNIALFRNKHDLSKIQIVFLQWLQIYHSLFQDLAVKENYISEEVIKNDIRTDAYLLYRSKKSKFDVKDTKTDKEINNTSGLPSVIFKENN